MVFPGTSLFKFKRIAFSGANTFARVKPRILKMCGVDSRSRPNGARALIYPCNFAAFFNPRFFWIKVPRFIYGYSDLGNIRDRWPLGFTSLVVIVVILAIIFFFGDFFFIPKHS